MCKRILSIKKLPCGLSNPGSNLRLLIINTDGLTGPWEQWNATKGIYEIIGPPPLVPGESFAEFEFTKDTCEGKYTQEGDKDNPSYKHDIGVDLAGYSLAIYEQITGLKGQHVIAVLKNKAGALLCQYGCYDDPLYVTMSGTTGKKSGDKRQNTIGLSADGVEFIPIPIPMGIVIPVLP